MTKTRGNTALKSENFDSNENAKFSIIKNDEETTLAETETETEPKILEEVKTVLEVKKVLSIQDIKDKASKLVALADAHSDLVEKRKEFEEFQLLHDSKKPEIRLTDVNGQVVKTYNQNVVEQFYVVLFTEYNKQIEKLETELNSLLS
ncbi:MAG: hypothetical protein NTZ33_05740 [Bacteroidetes bacterium]|nr:hypothetical protein [Bacteroidota bacterium]